MGKSKRLLAIVLLVALGGLPSLPLSAETQQAAGAATPSGTADASAGMAAAVTDTATADSGRVRDYEVESAVRAYWPLILQHPEGQSVRAGYARLLADDPGGAGEILQASIARDETFAPAHYGAALAIFRNARDTDEPAAYVQQALYHAEKAAALYPGYAGPHKLLGRIRLEALEDPDGALDEYTRALEVEPALDPASIRQIAEAYLETEAGQRLDLAVADSLRKVEAVFQLYPIVAAMCAERGNPSLAMRYFGRYFVRLPVEERLLYQDISLIASSDEVKAFKAVAEDPAARREYLVRFWAQRDPDLLTPVNERQLEHYRRIWYSRIHFGRTTKPWDRRGEVYVRYGEPDHRATSGGIAPPMSAAVEQIKERIAWELYDEDAVGQTFRGPVYPVYTLHDPGMDFPAELDREDVGLDPLPSPVPGEPDPIPPTAEELGLQTEITLAEERQRVTEWNGMTFIKWESWVYTDVAGGIEIVFTTEGPGMQFDYAPVPQADFDERGGLRRISQLVRFSPGMVMKRSIEEMPEFYLPGGREAFLDFYYDHAQFRGPDGRSRLELYYGFPPKGMEQTVENDDTLLVVGCAVGLFDVETGDAVNKREELRFRASGAMSTVKGAFIPHQVNLAVEPGTYDLRVQTKDMVTGRSGIYNERLEVEDFSGEALELSGLQMGWHVSTEGGAEKYKKEGDLWVVPMTTKAYQTGQNPFVYYEAYNLTHDEFGRSRIQLEYTIQHIPEMSGGFGRLTAAVGRLFRRKDSPQVSLTSDVVREETDIQEYFELDLKGAKAGVNRLTVKITDQTAGTSAEKEILFRYDR